MMSQKYRYLLNVCQVGRFDLCRKKYKSRILFKTVRMQKAVVIGWRILGSWNFFNPQITQINTDYKTQIGFRCPAFATKAMAGRQVSGHL